MNIEEGASDSNLDIGMHPGPERTVRWHWGDLDIDVKACLSGAQVVELKQDARKGTPALAIGTKVVGWFGLVSATIPASARQRLGEQLVMEFR